MKTAHVERAGSIGDGLQGCFITGTDTDIGKTTVTSALLRALLDRGCDALAVKPVQTGCVPGDMETPDASRYDAAAGCCRSLTLETFVPACSPHLAGKMAGREIRAAHLAAKLRASQAAEPDQGRMLLVEGAGGVSVPLNNDETMLDLMVCLGFPVVLVAPNRLGCINHILLSLEALRNRGLSVAAVVFNSPVPGAAPNDAPDDESWLREDNVSTVALMGRAPLVLELPFQPLLSGSTPNPQAQQSAWAELATCLEPLVDILTQDLPCIRTVNKATSLAEACAPEALSDDEDNRPFDLSNVEAPDATGKALLDFDRRHLWHPYTSATEPLPVYEAISAQGVRIRLRDGRELIDGMASWWCAIHGYGHPALVEALRAQASRMSHVMFGGLTHAPAVELAERLLPLLPGGLEHIFWTDSGSVSVEVALKMALQYWQARGHGGKFRFLTPRGGYHGDTLGAMSVCDPVTGMHALFAGVVPQQLFVSRPACRFDQPFDPACMTEIEACLAAYGEELAAVILEPVVQGAGGMWLYHPEYLRHVRTLCDRYGVLLILDEIATGFGRTGKMFAAEWAGISPDIMCAGKALTGGMMTLAATIASHEVAQGISARGGVFMHGPTFMGNPLACAVAVASLDELARSPWQRRIADLEAGMREELEVCTKLPGVTDVRVLGGIGVVELEKPLGTVDIARLQTFFVEQGVWLRPFNRVIYMMPPYIIGADDRQRLTSTLVAALRTGVHLA